MITVKATLLALEEDFDGYITYVFKNLEEAPFGKQYIMCVRFPGWIHSDININDVGYLTYKEIIAGIDSWYDGEKMIPYNYTNIIFVRFIKETNADMNSKDIII